MTKRPCTSELAVRERRGLLTPAERLSLDAHVMACLSCRAVREVGGSFEVPDAPELDDGARIQRLARAAEEWTKRGRPPRRWRQARALRRRLLWSLAACIVLCCGVAAAALGSRPWLRLASLGFSASRGGDASALSFVPAHAPAAARPNAATAEVAGGDPLKDGDEVEPVAAPEPPVPRATMSAGKRGATRTTVPANDTSEGIFRAANDARRRGDEKTAIALYSKLQRTFSASAEAALSAMPLGELLLASRAPGAALEQFDRSAGVLGGTFRPEALYGRARSLAALGDQAGERRAWQDLLDAYPACPYAETARRRLASK